MSGDRRPGLFKSVALTLVLLITIFGGCKTSSDKRGLPELKTVGQVDIRSYLGQWYEIARFPAWFQKRCVGSTATYSLREDGRLGVVNRCFLDSLDGKLKEAKGIARITDSSTSAKLEVSFFQPFWGDYWIIDLDPHYRYAVVGHPGRDYLWILSRCPTIEEKLYGDLLAKIKSQGFELERLIRTQHPQGASCFEIPNGSGEGG
jgi:apolipoprotein D and lipocalin family protein